MPRSPQGDSHSVEWPESKRRFKSMGSETRIYEGNQQPPMIRKTRSINFH